MRDVLALIAAGIIIGVELTVIVLMLMGRLP